MRKLNEMDLAEIVGSTVKGYHIEGVRIKRGEFTDSDHYGIILGRNDGGNYVTWQFHLDEDDSVNPYWGHYHMENREAALRDYNERDLTGKPFKVTITETLRKTVEVEAKNRQEAEQIVSENWKNSEYVLDADNFVEVEVASVSVDGEEEAFQ